MKIWLINQYAIPPVQAGITRHYTLARKLIDQGHRVTIMASSFDNVTHQDMHLNPGEKCKYEVCEGVPFLWLRTPPYYGNTVARIKNMLSFSGSIFFERGIGQLEKPDVIVGSSPHLFGAFAAERLAKRYELPFVLEVRDLWPQSLIDLGNISPTHPLVRVLGWVERYLYRRADRIISLLPKAANHLVQKGVRRNKIIWIPNGVDFDNVPSYKPPIESDKFVFMYTGAHGVANRVNTILDTAVILEKQDGWQDRVRFQLVGDGVMKPQLQERAQSEQLKTVTFYDPVPKKQVYQVLQKADAFIITSRDVTLYRWGTSPNKVFDYFSLARPVISSGNDPEDPVLKAQAGFVIPAEDAPAMAEAIKKLIQMSPEERWAMGLRGREYVIKHHDMAKLAQKMANVLEEVVAKYQS